MGESGNSRQLPSFDKSNVEKTAKQMYPGCDVTWSKSNVGGERIVIIFPNVGKDGVQMVPIVMDGKLMGIAKTLIMMYAAVQHAVVMNIAEHAAQEEKSKKENTVHVNDDLQQDKPDATDVRPGEDKAPDVH